MGTKSNETGREYYSSRIYCVDVFCEDGTQKHIAIESECMATAIRRARRYCRKNIDGLFQLERVVAYDSEAQIPGDIINLKVEAQP